MSAPFTYSKIYWGMPARRRAPGYPLQVRQPHILFHFGLFAAIPCPLAQDIKPIKYAFNQALDLCY
jgi:hypothetical protein